MATTSIPLVTFNNGQKCPMLGLGTWNSLEREVYEAVCHAIDLGYRHFDCAYYYQNEGQIGEAIQDKISQGVITREDIFITTKLWITFYSSPDLIRKCLQESLDLLQMDYVNLYLMHWPHAFRSGGDLVPFKADGKFDFDDSVDYVDVWKTMECLVDEGLARSIGVSNFNTKQLETLLGVARIKPVTNQIEVHPYLTQKKMAAFCRDNDLVITAYSPLSNPTNPFRAKVPFVLEDQTVKDIASRYDKTPAQVLIRYQIQLGNITVPKSVTKSRLEENRDIFDFELSQEDMDTLDGLDANGRTCCVPGFQFYQLSTSSLSYSYQPYHSIGDSSSDSELGSDKLYFHQ
ncbi:hypothetical protein M8J77_013594 [Diaphorina citri]|nr:hypothetical protein M8J77_013594 [Diaphorina citri]